MAELQCPRCGNPTQELQTVDQALLQKLRENGMGDEIPSQICPSCFAQIAGGIARGSVLLAKEKAREQKKLMLWKSRVNLLKRARQHMNEKAFSDAAVQYEKYIRSVEVVFDAKPGELNPEQFKDSARTQELTVVAGVYWDLLRIYDTSPRYGERQNLAAKKLGQFLRFTPIYPDIIRKAESFLKQAKNPTVIKQFLKSAQETKGGCFVATAAFDSANCSEVLALRNWRDEVLLKTRAGQSFTNLYYKISPRLANALHKLPFLKAPIRAVLRTFIHLAIRH